LGQALHPTRLITAIGTGDYKLTTYSLGDRSHTTKYAPVALSHLLGLSGARASVLATDQAAGPQLEELLAELRQANLAAEAVRVNDGSSPDHFLATLQQLIGLVDESERVILDVTFSLRHLPFAYLAALTYLTSFKGVAIDGIYYGARAQLRTGPDGVEIAPIQDLSVLFEATQWYHAVRTARESGDLRPLQRAVDHADRAERSRTKRPTPMGRLTGPLRGLANSIAAGLPLDAGVHARQVLTALQSVDATTQEATLARLSLRPFEEQLEQWAVPTNVTDRASIQLTEPELRRQLRLIRWYADRGNVQEALLLMREWLLSLAFIRMGVASGWLGYGKRKPIEAALNADAERGRLKIGSSTISSLWARVRDARDKLAHAGTDVQVKLSSAQEVQGWVAECEALLAAPFELAPPGKDRILLSPLGFTPGVLFTAASDQEPDQVIVLASEQTVSSARVALEAAGMGALPLETRVLADPYGGVEEAKEIAKTLQDKLAEACELVVNLTGGTTAMQLVAEQVAATASRLGIPVKRILLIDRRSPQDQRDNPYVLGEVVELPDARAGSSG
jgi:hypothetical protein